MGLSFGKYDGVCNEVALVVCPMLGPGDLGLEPSCYSRNVQINSTIIFQPGALPQQEERASLSLQHAN